MWARQTNWDWEGVGKYHWFEAEAKAESSMYASLCKANVRLYGYQVEHTTRLVRNNTPSRDRFWAGLVDGSASRAATARRALEDE